MAMSNTYFEFVFMLIKHFGNHVFMYFKMSKQGFSLSIDSPPSKLWFF